jgi:hypothetical protein
MNETTEIFLFILGGVFVCVGAGAGAVLMLLGKISDLRERVVAIEVRNEITDRRTAKLSHSPHDPYGWDPLIDKYLDRHYEMSMDEWRTWLARCEAVINDKTKPMDDRKMAVQLAAICWHKLMIDPPKRVVIERAANVVEDDMHPPE